MNQEPSESKENPEPKIVVDEDWKERVRRENAELEEKLKQEAAQRAGTTAGATATAQTDAASPEEAAETPQPSTAAERRAERRRQRESAAQIPPPDFTTLVGLFSTQAMVALGLIANPASGKPEPEPALARHFIDMLGVLEEKTKGNLTSAEAGLIDSTLHQLRMVYVELSKAPAGGSEGQK